MPAQKEEKETRTYLIQHSELHRPNRGGRHEAGRGESSIGGSVQSADERAMSATPLVSQRHGEAEGVRGERS